MGDDKHVDITLVNGFVAVNTKTDTIHLDVQYPPDNVPNGCVSARSAMCLYSMPGNHMDSFKNTSDITPKQPFGQSCKEHPNGLLRLEPSATRHRSSLKSINPLTDDGWKDEVSGYANGCYVYADGCYVYADGRHVYAKGANKASLSFD